MITFIRTRFYILTAIFLTGLASYTLASRQLLDSDWMLRWNHVDGAKVQLIYLVTICVLVLALPFETRITAALQKHKCGVLIFAAVVSFSSICLLEPNQEHRLFVTPFSICVIIVHVLALMFIVVFMVTRSHPIETQPIQPNSGSPRLIGLYASVIVILIGMHILSASEFMPFDVPDEPWLASMATNFADYNALSPSFIGSSYGNPDPILPRYYALMGIWLKIAGSSLFAMRIIPVLVLGLSIVVTILIFFRSSEVTLLQRLGALVTLLSLVPAIRMAHNLRADIGLALYGALVLWCLMNLYGVRVWRKRWGIVMGLSLYLGLETIPFIALTLAVVAGVALIGYTLSQRSLGTNWRTIALYAMTSVLSLSVYAAVRFLPNIQAQWSEYQRFNKVYAGQTNFGTLHFPLDTLFSYHLRFSFILSPIEIFLVPVALFLMWRWGKSSQRWVLGTFGAGLLLMQVVSGFAFGYWVLFSPLIAYAVAMTLRAPRTVLIGSFVFLPAMIAVPIFDLTAALQNRPNESRIQSQDILNAEMPIDTVLVGEDILWYGLHQHRTFIGLSGFWVNHSGHQDRTIAQSLDALGVQALLVDSANKDWKLILDTGMFTLSNTYKLGNSTYQLYWRNEG